MAACGVEWGRFQQLSLADPVNAAAAVLERYGIHDPLDPSRLSDQRRFIQACLAAGAHRPG